MNSAVKQRQGSWFPLVLEKSESASVSRKVMEKNWKNPGVSSVREEETLNFSYTRGQGPGPGPALYRTFHTTQESGPEPGPENLYAPYTCR